MDTAHRRPVGLGNRRVFPVPAFRRRTERVGDIGIYRAEGRPVGIGTGDGDDAGGADHFLYAGDRTVDVVSAVEGDAVQMGDLIAVLTPSGRSSGSTNYTNTQRISTGSDGVSSVLAPASGRVKAIHAEENQQVTTLQSAHAPLCYLSGDGQMQVAFDLAQGAACASGDTVQVLVDGDTVEG